MFLSNIFQEASQSLGLLDVCVCVGGGGGKELIREVRSQERLTYERSREVGGAWLKLTGGQNESLYLTSEFLPTFI